MEVIERDVVDVLRLDAMARELGLERLEARGHEVAQALAELLDHPREEGRGAGAVDVGRVEEEVLELSLLEELHEHAPVRQHHERRRRERGRPERVTCRVGERRQRQGPHGDAARPLREPLADLLGRAPDGPQLSAAVRLRPRLVEIDDALGSRDHGGAKGRPTPPIVERPMLASVRLGCSATRRAAYWQCPSLVPPCIGASAP